MYGRPRSRGDRKPAGPSARDFIEPNKGFSGFGIDGMYNKDSCQIHIESTSPSAANAAKSTILIIGGTPTPSNAADKREKSILPRPKSASFIAMPMIALRKMRARAPAAPCLSRHVAQTEPRQITLHPLSQPCQDLRTHDRRTSPHTHPERQFNSHTAPLWHQCNQNLRCHIALGSDLPGGAPRRKGSE